MPCDIELLTDGTPTSESFGANKQFGTLLRLVLFLWVGTDLCMMISNKNTKPRCHNQKKINLCQSLHFGCLSEGSATFKHNFGVVGSSKPKGSTVPERPEGPATASANRGKICPFNF